MCRIRIDINNEMELQEVKGSKTLVSYHITTRRQNPDNRDTMMKLQIS